MHTRLERDSHGHSPLKRDPKRFCTCVCVFREELSHDGRCLGFLVVEMLKGGLTFRQPRSCPHISQGQRAPSWPTLRTGHRLCPGLSPPAPKFLSAGPTPVGGRMGERQVLLSMTRVIPGALTQLDKPQSV